MAQRHPERTPSTDASGLRMDRRVEGTELARALAPMRQQLAMDGYDMHARVSDRDVLHVGVTAGADACEDCLVPKEVFATMLADQIASAGIVVDSVEVSYPTEH
jgi:hypothetical protein